MHDFRPVINLTAGCPLSGHGVLGHEHVPTEGPEFLAVAAILPDVSRIRRALETPRPRRSPRTA